MMAKVSYDVGVLKRAPILGVWMEKLPWNSGMSGSKVGHAITAYGYDRTAGTITVWIPGRPRAARTPSRPPVSPRTCSPAACT